MTDPETTTPPPAKSRIVEQELRAAQAAGVRVPKGAKALGSVLRHNSLADLAANFSLGAGAGYANGTNLSGQYSLIEASAFMPVTLNRALLSRAYINQGLLQTVIRQPVDDAFKNRFRIRCPELQDTEELLDWQNAYFAPQRRDMRKLMTRQVNAAAYTGKGNSDMEVAKDAATWARLFGGAGLIINTNQNFRTELNPAKLTMDSPLEFYAADRWELLLSSFGADGNIETPYNYYGNPMHASRVVPIMGIEPPSFQRMMLQGWGLSEAERCLRVLNMWLKLESLIFELLDEAKVDVFKIQGFNDALATDDGLSLVRTRLSMANQQKNFQNGLAMDTEDDWSQKQISWSGLAEIMEQLRTNVCAVVRFPRNILFGESAGGFGSGADSLEAYNTIVAAVRTEIEPVVRAQLDLRAQQRFGYIPEYVLEWPPLKELSGKEEEEVSTAKQNRIMQLCEKGLLTGKEASVLLIKEGLLAMETEVSTGVRDVDFAQQREDEIAGPAQKNGEPKAEK